MIEQQSSNLGHRDYSSPAADGPVVAFVDGVILLSVRLVTRRERERGPKKAEGLDRQPRRRELAVRRRKR
jgi:hypothetical protein